MEKKTKSMKKTVIPFLAVAVFVAALISPAGQEHYEVMGGIRLLTLAQAQRLSLANSSGCRKVQNKIELQEIKYAAAVKSIRMKKKNMATFRWTPLLSFKFPEKATLADEYEWQYKPLQITCTINGLKHQLNDERLACKENISLLYVEAYVCQEEIDFYERRLQAAEDTRRKNRARLAKGKASQADVDKMDRRIDNLRTQLALQMRTFEKKKKDISKQIGMDVTSGYTFTNPYVEADIPRSALKGLEDHTLENDQSYYETRLGTQLCLMSVNMTESLMRTQYGSKMNSITPYIRQARNGEDVDAAAFKAAYGNFLADIDQPWNGYKKILFVKINKEWFKGAISGSRYVEDDPYQLYTEALEYADAVREQEELRQELAASVQDSFETLITAKNSYESAKKVCDGLKEDADKAAALNRLGKMPFDELSEIQEEYEQQEQEALGLLAEYSKLLYSYDRLTCGGITSYLEGTDLTMAAVYGGNSYLAEEMKGNVYYYIDYRIADSVFLFGISVPEDYSLNITHYELYVNGQRIGGRTQASQVIEHLALDLDAVESSKVYLYEEDKLLGVCAFDSTVNQDVLEVPGGYLPAQKNPVRVVASYSCTVDRLTGMAELTVQKRDEERIARYQIIDKKGSVLGGSEPIPVSDAFRHLSLLAGNLSELKIKFFDSSGKELYVGTFMEGTASIIVENEK